MEHDLQSRNQVALQCEEFAEINEFAKGDLAGARRDYEAFLKSDAAERFPEEAALARKRLKQLPGVSDA